MRTKCKRFSRAGKLLCLMLALVLTFGAMPVYDTLASAGTDESAVETTDETPTSSVESTTSEPEPSEEPEPSAETEPSAEPSQEEESAAEMNADADGIYDPNPESVLDVWYLIEAEVFPHWAFAVGKEYIPFGYYCVYVENDPAFEEPYYTYLKVTSSLSRTGGNWSPSGQTGSASDPFEIEDETDLRKLATLVNGGTSYSGYFFVMTANIALTGTWTPIGYSTATETTLSMQSPFRGTFDGNEKVVSGLSISNSSACQGLFGCVRDATIRNLTVQGSVSAGRGSGLLVGASNGDLTIENCKANGTVSGGISTGGLIGWVNTSIESGTSNVISGKTVTIKDCYVNVAVTSSSYYVGGLVGFVWKNEYSTNNSITISNCHTTGSVKGSGYYVGGLAGFLEIYGSARALGSSIVVDGCSASGDVTGGSYYNGGLVGHVHNGVVIQNSWATGDVYGSSYDAGGLIGYAYGDSTAAANAGHNTQITVENCYATGNARASYDAGGLIGRADNTNIINSYAIGNVQGSVTAATYCGGLVGQIYSSSGNGTTVYRNCYATGTVLSTASSSGGLVGGAYHNAAVTNLTFENCYFDTTTTQKTKGLGGSYSSTSSALITGFTTEEMIDISSWSFSGTTVQDNINGKANGTGDATNPWYIDDDITYPYLWYQYDGHTENEVNYYLGAVYYTTNGTTLIGLSQDRADFSFSSALSAYFKVTSQGAARVYFPYTGTAANYPFNAYGSAARGITISVPISNYSFAANTLYSLGSISDSNIVAFVNVPYAEKTSDRETWVDGDKTTYTKKGDIITYEIKTTNPSTDYVWRNVSLTDELPEGLTLVDGSVNITEKWTDSSGNEVTSLTNTTVLGTDTTASVYYTCTYDSTTNQWTLYVKLPDHAAINAASGYVYSVTTQYQVLVGQDAVSLFPLASWAAENGDNIRNIGVATGTLHLVADETVYFEHKAEFDDENTDPVYDSYKVTYYGNGGTLSDGNETEYVDKYYLLDETYTILANTFDDGQGFRREGYDWSAWYLTANPTASDTALTVGNAYAVTYTLSSTTGKYTFSDVEIYAQWKAVPGSITIMKYKDNGTDPLPGVTFSLTDKNGTVLETLTTDGNGKVVFNGTRADGSTYAIDITGAPYSVTETATVSGYSLLAESIQVDMPLKSSVLNASYTGTSRTLTYTSGTYYYYYDVTYNVNNQAAIVMPSAGTSNTLPPYALIGGGIILFAAVCSGILWQKRRRAYAPKHG